MARLPRLTLAGQLHHVGLRGHAGAPVFVDDADRSAFLAMLKQAADEVGVAIHAYVLLDAEVRLLATPERADGLARTVQSLGRRYGAAFNRRHGRSGTLWDGRFRSHVLEQAWLFDATAHLETLPPAEDWPWSSAVHHRGRRRDPLLKEHQHYWSLGNTPFDRESAHAYLLGSGVSPTRRLALEQALRTGHPVGAAEFLQAISAQTVRPISAARRGRPRK
jgi:putative transposase